MRVWESNLNDPRDVAKALRILADWVEEPEFERIEGGVYERNLSWARSIAYAIQKIALRHRRKEDTR